MYGADNVSIFNLTLPSFNVVVVAIEYYKRHKHQQLTHISFDFQELSQKLGDDKSLSEHLQLPIQRINDYQLLLKVS